MAHGGNNKYYDPTDKVVYNAQTAEASDLNSINTAVDEALAQVADDLDTLETTSIEQRDNAEKWATNAKGDNPDPLQPTKWSALANAGEAEEWAIGDGTGTEADGVTVIAKSAKSFAEDAGVSEVNAKASEDAAKVSEDASKVSEDASKVSEDAAKVSEDAAKASEDAALISEQNAAQSETNIGDAEQSCADSAGLAFGYKDETLIARDVTQGYMMTADVHATRAETAETNAEGFALNAEGYATIAQSVACQNLEAIENFLLDSINIVGVKIYDTTKDPDGGAWREKMEQTPWYREPLNTATRGRTRKLPAVVAIVAETDKVTILDLTEPDLPMWMVFNAGAGTMISSRTITCVGALFGDLVIGTSDGYFSFSFKTDSIIFRNASSLYLTTASIINRNILSSFKSVGSGPIVNIYCNKVVMTVLDGNDYPTIFVATNGGASIIDGPAGKGTVVDVTDGGSVVSDLSVVGGKLYIAFSIYSLVLVGDIPTVDQLVYANWADHYYDPAAHPAPLGGNSKKLTNGAFGSSEGLTLLKENPMDPEKGAVNYVTTEYQSGWQQGDIKMATLADTVAETVGVDTETELIVGGTFDDEAKWNTDAAWEVTGGAAVSSAVGSNGTIFQEDVVTIGKKYRVSVEILSGTGTYRVYTGSSSITEIAGVGVYTFTTNAGGDNNFYIQCSGASFAGSIGSVSVVEVTEEIATPFGESALGYYDTFTASGTNIDSAISTSAGLAYTNTLLDSLVLGEMYEITVDLTVNSGEVPYIRMGNASAAVGDLSATMVNGLNTFTFRYDTTGFNYLWLLNTTITNFSATVSCVKVNNLAENGEFSRDNGEWTPTPDLSWSISGGTANKVAGVASSLEATTAPLTVGSVYRLTFTVGNYSGGTTKIFCGTGGAGTGRTANGTYSEVLIATTNGRLLVNGDASFAGSIDNISVEEVTLVDGEWRVAGELIENGQLNGLLTDDWVSGNGAITTASQGRLLITNGVANNGITTQAIPTIVGQVYEVSTDFTKGTAVLGGIQIGSVAPFGFNLGYVTRSDSGQLIMTFKAITTTTYISVYHNDGNVGRTSYFDNISVKAVQTLVTGWTNLDPVFNLSYDTFTTSSFNIVSAIALGAAGSFSSSNLLGLVVGKSYSVEIDVTVNSGEAPRLSSGTATNAGGVDLPYTQLVAGKNVVTFKHTTATEGYIWLSNPNAGNWSATTKLFELDVPDRSYNDNPLQVVGQLTKEPVAGGLTELVGWTGFGPNDYIEQPYNADLDFGTGDFHVMFWGIPNKAVNSFFMERVDGSSFTGRLNVLALVTTGIPYMRTGGTTITGTTSMSSTEYTHIVACRRNGNLELYVNGKLDATPVASADDLTLARPVNIGSDGAGLQNADSITLFRMGAGAPSADQIAFFYNTEKELFKENAICTLYNNDAGVTALDYDESIDKLYVAVLNGTTPKYMTFMGCENLAEGFTYQPGGVGQPVIPAYGESKGISAVGGKFLVGDGTRSYVWLPSINLREDLEKKKGRPESYLQYFSSTGAGQTQVQVEEGFKAIQVFDAGLLVPFTESTDGFNTYINISASAGDVTILADRKV